MKEIFLLIIMLPVASFASDQEFRLHLPCEKGDICTDFESDSGVVSLKKDPEMVIGEDNLISADIVKDGFHGSELNLHLNQNTAHKFSAITEKAIGNSIAIVVGVKVVSQPSVRQKIETDKVILSSGIGNKPFWDDILWIRAKAAAKRNAIGEKNNRELMIYAVVGGALLLAALWFVFRRRK